MQTRAFHESSDGDSWLIARDAATDHIFVRHQANRPSGGQVTDIEVSRFLTADAWDRSMRRFGNSWRRA